jgi:hypothetical protein
MTFLRVRGLAVVLAAATTAASGCDGNPDIPQEITIRVLPEGVPTFTGETQNAALVAFSRDGVTGWTALRGVNGVYHALATQWRYAVAVGCNEPPGQAFPQQTFPGLSLYYQTVADATDLQVAGCGRERDLVPVTVELENVPGDMSTNVSLGDTTIGILDRQPIRMAVPRGTVDVFATSYAYVVNTLSVVPVRGYRAPQPIDLSAPYALTIDYALALPFETHALRVSGFDPADGFGVRSSYATPHSLAQWSLTGDSDRESIATDPETTFAALDPRLRQPDDVSNLRVHTHSESDDLVYERYVRIAMKDPVDQVVELPPKLQLAPPTFDSVANRTAKVTFPNPPPTLAMADHTVLLYTAHLGPADEPRYHRWLISVKNGWAEGASWVTIETPDLTQLRGWTSDMALHPRANVEGYFQREDRTMPYDTLPVDGRKILFSQVEGELDRGQWPVARSRSLRSR